MFWLLLVAFGYEWWYINHVAEKGDTETHLMKTYKNYELTQYETMIDGKWQMGWGARHVSDPDGFVNAAFGPYKTLKAIKSEIDVALEMAGDQA